MVVGLALREQEAIHSKHLSATGLPVLPVSLLNFPFTTDDSASTPGSTNSTYQDAPRRPWRTEDMSPSGDAARLLFVYS